MPLTTEGSLNGLTQWLEVNPVATLIIDAEHRVTHWNPACAALTGISAKQMIGCAEPWRAFYPSPRPILADLVVDSAPAKVVEQYYPGKYLRQWWSLAVFLCCAHSQRGRQNHRGHRNASGRLRTSVRRGGIARQ